MELVRILSDLQDGDGSPRVEIQQLSAKGGRLKARVLLDALDVMAAIREVALASPVFRTPTGTPPQVVWGDMSQKGERWRTDLLVELEAAPGRKVEPVGEAGGFDRVVVQRLAAEAGAELVYASREKSTPARGTDTRAQGFDFTCPDAAAAMGLVRQLPTAVDATLTEVALQVRAQKDGTSSVRLRVEIARRARLADR